MCETKRVGRGILGCMLDMQNNNFLEYEHASHAERQFEEKTKQKYHEKRREESNDGTKTTFIRPHRTGYWCQSRDWLRSSAAAGPRWHDGCARTASRRRWKSWRNATERCRI